MPVRERAATRADRSALSDLRGIGQELRSARVGAGLALSEVGRHVGLSASQVSRIERAEARSATVRQLVHLGLAVGLDVRIRAYPGGDPIRDRGQVRLLDRFRRRVPDLLIRTEVALGLAGDLRAWDAWIDGLQRDAGPAGLPLEAETRLGDVQAVTRRLSLKMRDGGVDALLLVLADTRHNRAAVEAGWPSLADHFPVSPRDAWAALTAGRHPGASALLMV